ncbi:hypothetical protein [Flavobacterium sp. W21_SRS_FM6]|uniref:hypothetical protein n=1 Tax=Flavobacterium sp. W21_SRS_FM6 TaxID=3240268 RepID=UPI003F924DD9
MESWQKLLHPKLLKRNLITASLYLSAYEVCKNSIIEKPKIFFSDGIVEEKLNLEEYKKEVLSLAKSPLEATLLWFKSHGAIDDNDINGFKESRKLRNDIAHELPLYISESDRNIDQSAYESLLEVTHKVGVWWLINFELPINPDYDCQEIDENEIKTGTLIMLQMIMDIAYDNEPEEGYYYKNAVERMNS